jgi:hypothetical protein
MPSAAIRRAYGAGVGGSGGVSGTPQNGQCAAPGWTTLMPQLLQTGESGVSEPGIMDRLWLSRAGGASGISLAGAA